MIPIGQRIKVFMHVPKTGGISISKALNGRIFIIGHDWRSADYIHLAAWQLNWKINGVETYTFAFVRDPYDRVISAYNYLKQGGISLDDEIDGRIFVNCYEDFEDFILHGLEKAQKQIHFIPQYKYLYYDGKCLADFIGRYEQLEKDFKKVCRLMGFRNVQLNYHNHFEYPEKLKYTRKMKQIVSSLYREDFQLFYEV